MKTIYLKSITASILYRFVFRNFILIIKIFLAATLNTLNTHFEIK